MKCKPDETELNVIECPQCDGSGCKDCRGGGFTVECPRQFVGGRFASDVNLAGMCGDGDWPVDGGLLNQSAWLLHLKQRLDSETARIHNEDV